MSSFQSFLYGIIQSLSEFLPISSSAHLAVFPKIFDFQDPGVYFDFLMHVGTAFAVIVYFRKDIQSYVISFCVFLLSFRSKEYKNKLNDKNNQHLKNLYFVSNFLLATFVCVLIVFPLKDFALKVGRNPTFIAINLIVFGLVLYLVDRFKNIDEKKFLMKQLDLKSSLFIGIFQSIAIFPGVSRSGITITMGRFFGYSRDESSRFSFLLSLPLILGGALLKSREIISIIDSVDLVTTCIGLFTSFFGALMVIHFFLYFLKKINFLYFFVYRLIIGVLLLSFY